MRDLFRALLYFETFVRIDRVKSPSLKQKDILPEEKLRELQKENPGKFRAGMAPKPSRNFCVRWKWTEPSEELREKMRWIRSYKKRIKFAKRLEVLEAFRKSGNKPEWMILDVIPVLPPESRPLVPLDAAVSILR